MDVDRFYRLVEEAIAGIPDYFRARLDNVEIDVRPLATPDITENLGKHPWSLLGVYQGIPYNRRGPWYGNVMPDRILIFQKPIERISRSNQEIRKLVRSVVIHEVGHYFGLSDDELRRLEREADEAERSHPAETENPGATPGSE
jgi:predicted Zn-dependent protease with MMP-like domain